MAAMQTDAPLQTALPDQTAAATGAPSEPKSDKKRARDEPGSAGKGLPETPREWGGRDGPEPTRYGDWEKKGRCIDF